MSNDILFGKDFNRKPGPVKYVYLHNFAWKHKKTLPMFILNYDISLSFYFVFYYFCES
jgi:hypothetical protein